MQLTFMFVHAGKENYNIRLFRILFMMVCLFAAFVAPAAALKEDLSRQVLAEINLARTEPLKFAGFLRKSRNNFKGKLYQIPGTDTLLETHEGVAAVDEAIRFLTQQKRLRPLAWSTGLTAAAAELSREQGKSGATGHNGPRSGGMQKRIERHGKWQRRIGENIAYGPNDARMMVMQLLIDDGVSGRGHRKNLFSTDFGSAGVACGPHPSLESMCVIDFAGGFRE